MSILIGIFTLVLILVSVFLILVVLAQKAKSDGGVGAALGGGATEAAFGADTGNVLSNATIKGAIAFFILSFGLYLGHIYVAKGGKSTGASLPAVTAPAAPVAPVTTETVVPVTIPATPEATAPVEAAKP